MERGHSRQVLGEAPALASARSEQRNHANDRFSARQGRPGDVFARFTATTEALAPRAGQNERIGGSRAQHDLIEVRMPISARGAWKRPRAATRTPSRRFRSSGYGDRGGPVIVDTGEVLLSRSTKSGRVAARPAAASR
jgi:hypothetical protein